MEVEDIENDDEHFNETIETIEKDDDFEVSTKHKTFPPIVFKCIFIFSGRYFASG